MQPARRVHGRHASVLCTHMQALCIHRRYRTHACRRALPTHTMRIHASRLACERRASLAHRRRYQTPAACGCPRTHPPWPPPPQPCAGGGMHMGGKLGRHAGCHQRKAGPFERLEARHRAAPGDHFNSGRHASAPWKILTPSHGSPQQPLPPYRQTSEQQPDPASDAQVAERTAGARDRQLRGVCLSQTVTVANQQRAGKCVRAVWWRAMPRAGC